MEVSAEKLCRIVDLPVVSVVEPVMPEALAPVGSGPPDGSAFLRQAERTLQSLRAQEIAAKLSWLPDIEIGIFRQKDDLARRYWGGSVALSFPFWSAFGAGGSVSRASGEFEVESSRVEYDLRSWNVRWDEVTRGYELSRKEVQYYEAAVLPSARRTYSALMVAFDAGELDAGDIIAGFVEAKSVEREYLEAVRRLWEWNTDLGVLLCSADS
jgi:outer membrane protein TolC